MTNRKARDAAMMVRLEVHDRRTRLGHFKVDTGADANIIPVGTLHTLAPNARIEPTDWTLSTYNNQPLRVLGTTQLVLSSTRVKRATLEFVVIEEGASSIIGWESAIHHLHLMKRLFVVEKSQGRSQHTQSKWNTAHLHAAFPDVFNGLGCMH